MLIYITLTLAALTTYIVGIALRQRTVITELKAKNERLIKESLAAFADGETRGRATTVQQAHEKGYREGWSAGKSIATS